MKCSVYILILINLVAAVPQQKLRESDDGSKFYIETSTKYNWFEAWSECARRNMTLIAINTFEKHQQIDNLLRRLYDTCPILWIGGHENAVHDRHEWISTGETFTFTNWGPNQPEHKIKYNANCFLIYIDFQWHNDNCFTHKIGYICEENPLLKGMCQKNTISNSNDLNKSKNSLLYFKNGN